MKETKERLLDQLVAVAQEISEEQLLAVIDFTEYLKSKDRSRHPEQGSAEAILQALDRIGPLQFDPGELDILLTEIEHQRTLDLEENDQLST